MVKNGAMPVFQQRGQEGDSSGLMGYAGWGGECLFQINK